MKYTYLLITFVFLISCKQKTEKEILEENLTKNTLTFLQSFNQDIPDEKIDSLRLLRIDSITEQTQLIYVLRHINSKLKGITDNQEEVLNEMRLYSAIDADDLMAIKRTEMKKLSDSAKYYGSILKKLINKSPDTIKVFDYNALFVLKSHNRKTNIAKKDSLSIIFNKQHQIITDNDYLKQLIGKFNK